MLTKGDFIFTKETEKPFPRARPIFHQKLHTSRVSASAVCDVLCLRSVNKYCVILVYTASERCRPVAEIRF